jgi:phage regulator Rha-like protein
MEPRMIRERIYEIRGQKVMLDFDLAGLYGVETKVFNQAVKRNGNRFPEDFMFRLTEEEWESINYQTVENSSQNVMSSEDGAAVNQSQIVTGSEDGEEMNWSQNVTSSGSNLKHRGKTYLPYAFTEHGVTMLASVLKSEKAVQMSIAIVRAFVALKQLATRQTGVAEQLEEIRQRLGEHDVQLNSIYEAIENLLDEKVEQKKWQDRQRIGFK